MNRRLHLETIKRVKEYINEKDYEGLKIYIENREKEINNMYDDKSSEYIDELTENLK